ncbi:DUF6062 family protein [Thermococcus sp.]
MDLIGIYLKEALENPGCPVCNILQKYEKSEITTILYEHVNNPSVRDQFKESLGLCTYHAWKLKEVAYSDPLLGALGVAVIYDHMLSVYIESLEQGRRVKVSKCFLCRRAEEKERSIISGLSRRIEELLPVYKNSGAILCKKHYEMLKEELRKENPPYVDELTGIQIEKLRIIRERVERFIDKFDYRSTEAPTKKEAEAVVLAIESLKGLPLQINFGETPKKPGIRGGIFGSRA